jgi:hypothetical protein
MMCVANVICHLWSFIICISVVAVVLRKTSLFVGIALLLFLGYSTNSPCVMGKLNVTVLRYLTKEDFRVLTAVGRNMTNIIYVNFA